MNKGHGFCAALLGLVLGCGPAINHDYVAALERCAGPHPGSFSGELAGPLHGELRLDGRLSLTLSAPSNDLRISAYIDADGVITGVHEAAEVHGAYDFERCEGAGGWHSALLDGEGDWEIHRTTFGSDEP